MASKRSRSAMSDALNALARRPLTEAELRDRLLKREWDPGDVDSAVERLRQDGYVDDAKLALDYIVLRSARLALGPLKLIVSLRRRGVKEEIARAAWREALESGDVDPLSALRRRIEKHISSTDGPLDSRRYARVYNALLRAGFEGEQVRKELEPFRASDASRDSGKSRFSSTNEASHDVP